MAQPALYSKQHKSDSAGFQLGILRIRKMVYARRSNSLLQRALALRLSCPRGSFESPSIGLRRKRQQKELPEKKLRRDAFQTLSPKFTALQCTELGGPEAGSAISLLRLSWESHEF